ncbi:ParA family protein [Bacillus smithii]|uniref:ParA family protein n=1 Tax=Bacillus smithii TaxID=1479 RepID=UPI003D227965
MNTENSQCKQGKVISFINMKGGVGKTTLCVNIGYTLAKHFNKKVLIIDMDPQFNATQALMEKFKNIQYYEAIRDQNKTISYVLNHSYGGVASKAPDLTLDDIIEDLETENLHLIPGDLAIIDFESSRRGSERILKEYIDKNNLTAIYEYILIDAPPTYSIFSISSLIASDYYIVPIAPDVFSALGYDLLNRVISNDLALKGATVKELGIVFTLVDSDRMGRLNVMDSFEGHRTFDNKIKEHERIRTGKLETYMLDMASTKDEIIQLTSEFKRKLEDDN